MGCWVPIVGVLGCLWGGEGHVFGIGGQQKAASGCWVPMGGIWGACMVGGSLVLRGGGHHQVSDLSCWIPMRWSLGVLGGTEGS